MNKWFRSGTMKSKKRKRLVLFIVIGLLLLPLLLAASPTINNVKSQFDQISQKDFVSKQLNELKSTKKVFSSAFSQCQAESTPQVYEKMLILFILIVIFLYGLVYLAGAFFQSSKIMAYLQTERTELVITVLFAMFFIFYPATIKSITGHGLFSVVDKYNFNMLNEYTALGLKIGLYEWMFASISGITLPLGGVGKVFTVNLSAVFKAPLEASILFLRIFLTTYSMWLVNLTFFCLIKQWFFTLFIPMGLVFRTFSPTRAFGNAIVAISLAFLIMYPLMFYIDSVIVKHDIVYKRITSLGGMWYERYWLSKTFGIYYNTSTSLSVGAAAFLVFYCGSYLTAFIVPLIINGFFSMIYEAVHIIIIYGFLLPVLNIYITLTFAREIAYWLGTELSLTALVRLI